jgi:uncharacterized membrane protein
VTNQHDEETGNCHNCGAAVTYHYCALCGQETRLHVPSAGEFIHEFVGHYVALEGRLWTTLHKLLFRPGFLTAEYIAGRRVRYVEPLRVYLTFSVLFFFVLKLAGTPVGKVEDISAAEKDAAQAQVSRLENVPLISGHTSSVLVSKINTFAARPETEQSKILTAAFFAYVPYAMFVLMPVFALYLKLLYLGSGRRYGEHLLFALHTNGFAFALFSLVFLTSFIDLGLVDFCMALWLILYLPMAMQRVYGGTRLSTALRWVVLTVLHLLSIAAAIAGAFGAAMLA